MGTHLQRHTIARWIGTSTRVLGHPKKQRKITAFQQIDNDIHGASDDNTAQWGAMSSGRPVAGISQRGVKFFQYNIGCMQQPGCQTWNGAPSTIGPTLATACSADRDVWVPPSLENVEVSSAFQTFGRNTMLCWNSYCCGYKPRKHPVWNTQQYYQTSNRVTYQICFLPTKSTVTCILVAKQLLHSNLFWRSTSLNQAVKINK